MEKDELKEMICEKLKIDFEEYWEFVKGVSFNALVSPDVIEQLEYYGVVKRDDMLSDEARKLLIHYAGIDVENNNKEEMPYAY